MVSWLLEKFPETAHIANSNGDQVIHFAAAEGISNSWFFHDLEYIFFYV